MNHDKLGVGLLYNPSLDEYFQSEYLKPDYLEIIPDMFWSDEGKNSVNRFVPMPEWRRNLDLYYKNFPLVAHNIGMSLGTMDYFDMEYLYFMKNIHNMYKFKWHSDHLSFIKLPNSGPHDHNAGLAIPVPYDKEYLQMMEEKINIIQDEISIPFILENNVYFIEYEDQDYTEVEFINKLVDNTSCGILLDIHNLYTNSRNHFINTKKYIDELNMEGVLELHIAGGNTLEEFYIDSHAGPCPDELWEILDYAVSKANKLNGITFEFHESYFPILGFEGIEQQLKLAKSIWDKYNKNSIKYECC